MLKSLSYDVSPMHARSSSGYVKPIDDGNHASLSNEIHWSNISGNGWTMSASNNTKNEVSNSSSCENDNSKNQEQNSL